MRIKKFWNFEFVKKIALIFLSIGIIVTGIFMIWVSRLQLPDFRSFNDIKIQSSSKIYDRTGKILLYDVNQNIKRTIIPYEQMGVNIKNATVAIEDSDFYNHNGIRISSIIRATIWTKLTGKKIQGGSTITQQLVKNTLLTNQKSISRKIKEWILALKIERVMSKDEILALYLNETPYGGNIYGIKEASTLFFGKNPADLDLAESAYLAAIPNAPTRYSPYGKNRKSLDNRKNLVLKRMLDLKFITDEDYQKALKEEVVFLPEQPTHIAAPHFVFFIKDYLEKKYGANALEEGGLKVITTLDYNLEMKAEEVAKRRSLDNEKNWNGKNTAIVVIDPKTGQILSMVGSRDYFDRNIDGNFNVATASRQPGSSFKPIVYAAAIEKGYTEKTTLFDVPTEFNSSCGPTGQPLPGHKNANCYMPDDYDNKFRGPMTLKDALAQSINIVAVKVLYLVGVPEAIKMAKRLGISTLNDPDRYGLSLVIGGGETTLLDMTSVYSVFANNGLRNPYTGIISVENGSGNVLEKFEDKSYQVIDSNITRNISDMLSDNVARAPTFGLNSSLVIPDRQVAVKTGTTNNNKDAWTIGYTPSITVGVWVGNNENTPMKKGGVALAGPIWNEVVGEFLKNTEPEYFDKPDAINPNLPPVIRGFWQGNHTFFTDSPGNIGAGYAPNEEQTETSITDVHSILYWIDKANPLVSKMPGPSNDPQYINWEYGVQKWWEENKNNYKTVTTEDKPQKENRIYAQISKPIAEISGIDDRVYNKNQTINLSIDIKNQNLVKLKKVDLFVNNTYLTSLKSYPIQTSFMPSDIENISSSNTLKVIVYDANGNFSENEVYFKVNIN